MTREDSEFHQVWNSPGLYQVDLFFLRLLEDSPITRDDVRQDIKDFVDHAEYGLAFDTLCSWIYEDDLAVDESYYRRLQDVSSGLGSEELVRRIGEELVRTDKSTESGHSRLGDSPGEMEQQDRS